jgi:hypothetical protein
VVPIVGGMSSEKQERLLRRRPHIVVGTPGRLWELMSSGEQHLVEVHTLFCAETFYLFVDIMGIVLKIMFASTQYCKKSLSILT